MEEELEELELLELVPPQDPRSIHTPPSLLFCAGFWFCVHQRASYFLPLCSTWSRPLYTAVELQTGKLQLLPPEEEDELEELLLELEEELEDELLDPVPPQLCVVGSQNQ